eukprot:Amastigsp_a176187_12.p2 type:complete len:220 gc:universal Amastigsp_a176187_12:346-1005(+)
MARRRAPCVPHHGRHAGGCWSQHLRVGHAHRKHRSGLHCLRSLRGGRHRGRVVPWARLDAGHAGARGSGGAGQGQDLSLELGVRGCQIFRPMSRNKPIKHRWGGGGTCSAPCGHQLPLVSPLGSDFERPEPFAMSARWRWTTASSSAGVALPAATMRAMSSLARLSLARRWPATRNAMSWRSSDSRTRSPSRRTWSVVAPDLFRYSAREKRSPRERIAL